MKRWPSKILIVDDDQIALEAARERLVKAGYEVCGHHSAIGTSEVIVREQPHVLLLDVMMPGLSGDQLASVLQRNERTRDVAIVLHSSKHPAQLQELLEETGAAGSIQKTHDARLFMIAFDRLMLELRRKRDQVQR